MLLRNKTSILFFLLILSTSVLADSHYSFEHAAEMYTSKRIDWRSYGPEAFKEAIEDKNQIALSTAEFINERLDIISTELDTVEVGLEEFKEANNLTNIDYYFDGHLHYKNSKR